MNAPELASSMTSVRHTPDVRLMAGAEATILTDEVLAVESLVSFRIQAGETSGLLGPNGADRTTIISMAWTRPSPDQ